MREKTVARRIGLARSLSKLGYCSRAHAADLIRQGRVSLNGVVRRDPETPVGGRNFQIAVDGRVIHSRKKIYLALNKPRGVVTSAADEKHRKTVYNLLDNNYAQKIDGSQHGQTWIAPVGRLDKASEGLLLFTNDSEWAASVAAPETHLDKTYHVQVGIVADSSFIHKLIRGTTTNDGEWLRVRHARYLRGGKKNCWIEIVLDEGRNRHIRRMMESLGVEVLRLVRVAIGPLRLGDLPKGQSRLLTADEKKQLDCAMRKNQMPQKSRR